MSIIEEIKRDVRHDEDCNALRYCPSDAVNDATCNCSRRRKKLLHNE
jgi:hypothetical protein